MPRVMTTAMATALCAQVLRPALLCAMTFASGTVYVWTGLGSITWDSMTFIGIGDLGEVSTVTEASTIEAQGITITLNGIPGDLVSDIAGKMDQPTLNDSGETCSCSITVENVLVDLNRAVNRRYTDSDQQVDVADTIAKLGMSSGTVDTGFRFVPGVQERITYWGRAPSSSNNV